MKLKLTALCNKCVNRETIAYLICGVLTTVINYVVNAVSYYGLHLETLTSNNIAWVISVIFAFFANKIFVFQSKVWRGRQFWHELYTFVAARLLSLAFDDVFMFVTVDLIKIENWIAKIADNVFVVVMNYFASKFFIFKKKETVHADHRKEAEK